MRIEGSRLVVACPRCGVSVVAVGWSEGSAATDGATQEPGAPAAASGEMVSGRLELEPEDDPTGPPGLPRAEEEFNATEVARQPVPPRARETLRPVAAAAPREVKRWPMVASGAAALACVLIFFAWRAWRTERAPEPKAGDTSPAASPAAAASAAASPAPTSPAVLPAAPSPAPVPQPTAVPTARSVSPERTSKIPAVPPAPVAAAVPPSDSGTAAMTEEQALSSGLIDAEEFQDRTGKVMTYLLFCRNLELARNRGASLGSLDVTLLVSPSGAVSEVRLDRASDRSGVGRCIRENLAKLEFPNATGRTVEIRRHLAPTESRKTP